MKSSLFAIAAVYVQAPAGVHALKTGTKSPPLLPGCARGYAQQDPIRELKLTEPQYEKLSDVKKMYEHYDLAQNLFQDLVKMQKDMGDTVFAKWVNKTEPHEIKRQMDEAALAKAADQNRAPLQRRFCNGVANKARAWKRWFGKQASALRRVIRRQPIPEQGEH